MEQKGVIVIFAAILAAILQNQEKVFVDKRKHKKQSQTIEMSFNWYKLKENKSENSITIIA